MDQETVSYIINHHARFMTKTEGELLRHSVTMQKLLAIPDADQRERYRAACEANGWLVTNDGLLEQLANGSDAFLQTVALRIYREQGGEDLLRYCPRCGRLVRTPLARQCRHCEYDWH